MKLPLFPRWQFDAALARWVALLGAGLCLMSVALASSRNQEGSDEIVPETITLPDFVITAPREDAKWSYARVGEFEILTACPAALSTEYVQAQYRGKLYWPPPLLPARTNPTTVLLFDQVSRNERTPRVAKQEFVPASKWGVTAIASRGDALLTDQDSLILAANLHGLAFWNFADGGYMRRLLHESSSPPPPWLTEGFFGDYGVFGDVLAFADQAKVRLAKIEYSLTPGAVSARLRWLPLNEFFRFDPSAPGVSPEKKDAFMRQAGLFVRWGVFGTLDRENEPNAFWLFAYQAWHGGATEELFTKCLNLSYAEAEKRCLRYQTGAARSPQEIPVPRLHDDLGPLQKITYQPAQAGVIARILGNWSRLQAKELRVARPDLAARHEIHARRMLVRAVARDPADAQIRGILGLLEFDTGHPTEARPNLEAAFAAKAAGTRALLALARLRLTEAGASGDKLTVAQLESVFALITQARERTPALIETYRLIGEVWSRSAAAPRREHLAVLLEGVKNFPYDLGLLLQIAELYQRYGFSADAQTLAKVGLQRAGTPKQRQPFTQLLAQLNGSTAETSR